MREIPPGARSGHRLRVTQAMTVDFEQSEPGLGKLHPVYATYWLAKHFELVSRKLTLPYLDEGETGIGFELSVRHLAPTLPGMAVEVEAVFSGLEGNRVFAQCRAVNSLGDVIGEGSTTQVILGERALQARFEAVRRRLDDDQSSSSRSKR